LYKNGISSVGARLVLSFAHKKQTKQRRRRENNYQPPCWRYFVSTRFCGTQIVANASCFVHLVASRNLLKDDPPAMMQRDAWED
jgi:hypothetical protein